MKKGIALIALIIIITVVVVTVGGITSFITNGILLAATQSARLQAFYAAQAGIYATIYNYEAASWSKASNIDLGGGVSYSVGKDANFLLIDASQPEFLKRYFISGDVVFGNCGLMGYIATRNVCADQAITIDKMKVEWYNVDKSDFFLRGISWGELRFNGKAASGTTITLNPPCTINANSGAGNVNLVFPYYPGTEGIYIATFFCTDGSQRKAVLFNRGYSGNKEFSITSTGTVSGKVNVKRTIEATYDYGCKNITSWREVASHI